MRILVAPDKFKGSLGALEAAAAMRRGILRACPGAEVRVCPLSDGGDGMAEVLAAHGGMKHAAFVPGPLGTPVHAEWVMLEDGETAVIESAAAVGLSLVPKDQRSPAEMTTAGVGALIEEALAARARRVVVGLGGSATTDGGAGMAQRLGIVFDGAPVPMRGRDLGLVRAVDGASRDRRLAHVALLGITDVDNPLTGPTGAAMTYGPQKGASAADVTLLEDGLVHLARIAGDEGVCPGDGAAGGLGYGLRVFLGGRLSSGIEFMLDQCAFDDKLEGADLVLTGEGRLDAQTARGKVIAGVSERCKARGIPAIALVGAISEGAGVLFERGLTACFSLATRPMSEAEAMANAAKLLEELAANVVLAFSAGR